MDFSKKEFLCSFLKWSALQLILLLVVVYIIPFLWTEAEFSLGHREHFKAALLLRRTNWQVYTVLNIIVVQILLVIPCTFFFCVGKYYLESKHKTIITYVCYMIFSTILNYYCSVGEELVGDILEYVHFHYISWNYLIPTLLYPLIIGVLQLIIFKLKKVK